MTSNAAGAGGGGVISPVGSTGSGTVTAVTAADSSIVAGGTPGVAVTLRTGTLDVIAADHPPAASWSNNSNKITSLANGGAAQDAAAWGQTVSGILTTAGDLVIENATPAPARLAVGSAGQFLGVSSSGLPAWQVFNLAKHVYAPGTQATPDVSTTTMAAFDTTNIQTGSFTAPASGEVTVRVSFSGKASASGTWVALGLAAHGTVTPLVANEWECEVPTADAEFPFFIEFTVSGLTAGTSYNFDLLGCVTSAATFSIMAIGKTTVTPSLNGTNQGGPVTFTVTAD